VGAYGQEVADTISAVSAFDRKRRELVSLPPGRLRPCLSRQPVQERRTRSFVVLSVSYRLAPNAAPSVRYPELARRLPERPTLSELRQEVLAVRRAKSMVVDPGDENCRSVRLLLSEPDRRPRRARRGRAPRRRSGHAPHPQSDGRTKLSAAWLIERAGLTRGERMGAVGLSTRHTLALVCHAGARATDVIAFARRVRAQVADRFGVRLQPEPQFWGFRSIDSDGLPDDRVA
jgi:UDP-N-acetylmuramate dehydrogenase